MAAVTANSGIGSAFIAFLSGLLIQVSELMALLLLVLFSVLSGRNRLAGDIAQPLPSSRPASKDFPLRSQSPSSSREDEDEDEKRKIPTVVTFRTPLRQLFKAIVTRDMDRVFRLLKMAPFLASTKHKDGWYPIHAAILTGDIEMVKLVAEHCQDFGVSLSIECYSYGEDKISPATLQTREEELGHSARLMKISGVKPLHLACLVGSSKIIEYVIEKGANMKEQDNHDRGPLDFFDGEEHGEALDLFCEYVRAREERESSFLEVTIEALFDAMKKNKKGLFESLLSQKADLANERTSQGFTILQAATIRQLTPYVKAVLAVRILNINVKDKRSEDSGSREDHEFALYRYPHEFVKGATALHYACLTANLEIIELLLKAGADWTAKDSQGRHPEDLFCDKFDRDIKRSFIQLRDQELERMKEGSPVIQVVDEAKIEAKIEGKSEEANDDEVDERTSDASGEDWEDGEGKAQEPASEPSLEFENYLNRKVVGQKGPIRTVAKAINLRKNGWIDPNRPLVLLFLGGSGVGKTELAKQIALHLYYPYIGDCSPFAQREKMRQMVELRSFIRLDMNEFQERHTVANITGPPKGYVGYDDKCSLTYGLDLNSSAIVLLDEIEKAHPDVLSVFLQIFDEGLISNSKMGTIHCENAVFIMTSNLAADEIKDRSSILRKAFDDADASGKPEEYDRILGDFGREIQPILKECFKRDELIGRINQTVFFLPFDDEQVLELVTSQLNYWKQIAYEKDCIDLSWSMDVVQKLAKSYDQKFGARSIIHEIQHIAVNVLADAHVRGDLKHNSSAYFTTDDEGKIVLQVKPPIA